MALSTHREWAELLRAVAEPAGSGVAVGAAPGSGELLSRAFDLIRDVTPDAVGCSVTTIAGESFHTPVFSNALADDLDRAQYVAGDGPCMAAARERRPHSFDALTDGDRFPGFAEAAAGRGVRSSISLPLAGPELPSAINLYASSSHAFDAERPRAVAGLLARCVSALLSPARLPAAAEQDPDGPLEAAQARGRQVSDAEAALMATRSVSRPEALNVLIQRARAQRRSIFEVARDVGRGVAGEVGRGVVPEADKEGVTR